MGNGLEQVKNQVKKVAKAVGKKVAKSLAPIIALVVAIVAILAGFTYVVTLNDATYVEGDDTNTMYAVREYTRNVIIDDDGTIRTSISAQDLWNKMKENNNRVTAYLDNAAELQKLMNAEIITNYPDTRSADEIDEPLDEDFWDNLNKDVNSTEVQGIIKFKRARTDGTTITMTFVSAATFYDWVEEYNSTGDESILEEILTHFTILSETSTSTTSIEVDSSGDEIVADCSEAIVEAAKNTSSPGAGLCQSWVRQVYANAGLGNVYYASAYEAYQANLVSTDKDNIPIGAAVYSTGSSNNPYGHVGIYIGDGNVMDNVSDSNGNGYIRTISLDDWIAEAEAAGNTLCGGTPGWLGWGWQAGGDVSTTTGTSSTTTSTSYYVVVASYSETTETVESNDPDVETYTTTTKSVTTQKVDYQSMVSGYQMPFDYLWEWIVAGRKKEFGLDVADLVYGSTLEITIHDNETTITDVDTYEYTEYMKYHTHDIHVTGTGTKTTTDSSGNTTSQTVTINEWDTDGDTVEETEDYTTTYTTITVTDTLNISVTTADVWIVSYYQEFTYEDQDPVTSTSGPTEMDENKDYSSTPDASYDSDLKGIGAKFENSVKSGYTSSSTSMTCTTDYYEAFYGTVTNENTVERKKYIEGTKVIEGKDDLNSDEENFVTLLRSSKHYDTLSNVTSAPDWLFEMIESNESTVDMLDLTKYLLYKATGKDYGVTEYDFSVYDADNFTSVGSTYGGTSGIDGIQGQIYDFFLAKGMPAAGIAAIMGNIEAESSFDPTAVNSRGASGLCQWYKDRFDNLVSYANSKGTDWTDVETQLEFLWQELEGSKSDVKNVLMSTTEEDEIEYATWYFGRYFEVSFLVEYEQSRNNEDASYRYERALYWYQQWEENHTSGGDIVSIAKACHDYLRENNYTYKQSTAQNTIPLDESGYKTVDCSSFVTWVLYEYGYTDLAGAQHSTSTLYDLAIQKGWEVKSGKEAVAGDIMLTPDSHTSIYAGNGYFYDCGSNKLIQDEISTQNPSSYTYSITVTAP